MIIIQKPDGSYQHNDYNASNELIKISVYNKLDQLLYESVYNYDDRGNLISENELTTLLSRTSTYDQSNQLVVHASMLDQTPLNNYNFSYDDAGNILSLQENDLSNSFLYTSSNRIMSVNGQNAEYDNDGNLTMITLDGVTKNYQYDSRNRLISDSILLYGYDSENKRVSKTNGTDITNYTINVNGRLPEVLVKTVNGESTYFVYGIGLISQEKGSDYSVYHYDYRGNTVLITDMSGQVTDSFIYGPYGTIEDRTGNSDIDFLFSGQLGIETDENGLVYLNDRYYDPSVGRFLNEDPYSLKYQDILNLNLYSYCANDPLNNVDPTGNYIETIIDIVSVISSAVEFYKNPTIFSFSFLVADTVAALLPGAVAPSAVSKGIRWGDEAVLAFKGGLDGAQAMLKTQSANAWGTLADGTNQGIKHFSNYWEAYPERIPSIANRLGVDPADFSNTVSGFENFTKAAQNVIGNPTQMRVVNGKSLYFVEGAENVNKGVTVIVQDGKIQSMMPTALKDFLKLK